MRLAAYCWAGLCVALPAFLVATSGHDPVKAASPSVAYPQVARVQCAGGSGTAFKTERGWVSAAHVTSLFGCEIGGVPVGATAEGKLDFSRLDYADKTRGFKINCEGFKPGTYVFAIGYGGGYTWQTMTRHLATFKDTDDGLRFLLGSPTVIPGMSGGPILNEQGEVVGMVNMYAKLFPVSFSRALKDTSLCR
jgi:hypothetical protein